MYLIMTIFHTVVSIMEKKNWEIYWQSPEFMTSGTQFSSEPSFRGA